MGALRRQCERRLRGSSLHVFTSTRPLESIKQGAVVEDVRRIQIEEARESEAARSDIAHIQRQVAREFARHRKREVLNIRRVVVRIESRRILILLLNRDRLHRERAVRYWNLAGQAPDIEV